MKELPLNVQTFKHIINKDLLYVDKTQQVYNLVKKSFAQFFLSRPRRFGKSLLISILEEVFKGNKELFKGLYIYDKIDWKPYPIIRIDFSKMTYKDGESLEAAIISLIENAANKYEIVLTKDPMKEKWEELIEKIHAKTQSLVVLLIDEYDDPINNFIGKSEKLEGIQEILRQFYKTTKALNNYWRMIFITGITKYAKLSLFSTLNNLTDISVHPDYHDVLGIGLEEIEVYFEDYLLALEQKYKMGRSSLMEYIRWWYNGYSWNGKDKFYNPYSLLLLFDRLQFKNYWFATGTPSLLIQQIKKTNESIASYEQIITSETLFDSFEVENMPLDALLWQTGYLTITNVDDSNPEYIDYTLSFPNNEVRLSFSKYLLATYTQHNINRIDPNVRRLKQYLVVEKFEEFVALLQRFIGGIPSKLHIKHEFYYHSIFYMILTLAGVKLRLEERTYKGDVDGVLEFADKVYLIEFKYSKDDSRTMKGLTNEAINQIEQKDYARPYIGENPQRRILLLGIGVLEKEVGHELKELELA